MRERYDRIVVQPVTGALGAEILDVDLADELDNETFSEIYDAFLDHLVLFFRDQQLTPEQHKDFARRFGALHVHPLTEGMPDHPEIVEVIKEADEHHNWGGGWHTDLPILAEPPMGSVLYARDIGRAAWWPISHGRPRAAIRCSPTCISPTKRSPTP